MSTDDLLAEARRLGYTMSPTANGHLSFRHESGALVHVGGTPSCHRALRNAKADLRRELRLRGVDIVVEQRKLPPKGERERARKPRPTPTPAAQPAPTTPPAGAFRPQAHGRLAGTSPRPSADRWAGSCARRQCWPPNSEPCALPVTVAFVPHFLRYICIRSYFGSLFLD
jgi:hypothetical protein